MTQPTPDLLFNVLDATWPAARYQSLGPWMLREGRGGGQRVSSATAEGAVTESDIAQAETGMQAFGQTPLFMLRGDDTALDGWLAARGYDIVDPVTMLIAPSQSLADDLPLTSVIPSWPPLAIQREIWDDAGIGPARLEVMNRVTGPKAALLGRKSDTPAGTTFIAAHEGVAMMHSLEVATSERRLQGIGRDLLTGCANWAIQNGADWLALAVIKSNKPACALYQNAGMTPDAEYHYRRAPKVPE